MTMTSCGWGSHLSFSLAFPTKPGLRVMWGGVSHPEFSCLSLAHIGWQRVKTIYPDCWEDGQKKQQESTGEENLREADNWEMSAEHMPCTTTTATLLPCSLGDLWCKDESQNNWNAVGRQQEKWKPGMTWVGKQMESYLLLRAGPVWVGCEWAKEAWLGVPLNFPKAPYTQAVLLNQE